MLEIAGSAIGTGGPDDASAIPDLRSRYTAFERGAEPADLPQREMLLSELDEIVDATNGLAVLAGVTELEGDRF